MSITAEEIKKALEGMPKEQRKALVGEIVTASMWADLEQKREGRARRMGIVGIDWSAVDRITKALTDDERKEPSEDRELWYAEIG